jgi:type II secretory pathway pseudopilin PulG
VSRVGHRAGPPDPGYALVALLATIAVMLVAMSAAVPSWRYLMKNDREEELVFRGGEIADAIGRYQRKNGNALPSSLEVLVRGKYLRRAYKDPMTKDGKWRLIRPGEVLLGGVGSPASRGGAGIGVTSTTTTTRPSAFSPSGTVVGGFQGVASTSTEKSLRLFNGRSRYDEWVFAPGLPRVVGRPIGLPAGAPAAGGRTATPASTLPRAGVRPGVVTPPVSEPYVVPP